MITDDYSEDNFDKPQFTTSPAVQKQIQKLLADDEAQRSRTWSYYQQIKKEDEAKYFSPKIQKQLHRDAEALGDAFNDGDFND